MSGVLIDVKKAKKKALKIARENNDGSELCDKGKRILKAINEGSWNGHKHAVINLMKEVTGIDFPSSNTTYEEGTILAHVGKDCSSYQTLIFIRKNDDGYHHIIDYDGDSDEYDECSLDEYYRPATEKEVKKFFKRIK